MHPEAPYQYSISIYASDFLGACPSCCTDPSELVRVYVWKAWPVEYSCVCFGRVAGTKNLSKNLWNNLSKKTLFSCATNLPKKGDSSLNPSNLQVKCLVQSDLKPCTDWHTQRPRARRKLSEKHHLEACGSGWRLMTRGMGKRCQIIQWNTCASGGYTRRK